ncbi:hypothetical protein PTSG_09813 [Salpingoeca rosetta]|uniref:PH domain-containing protein n=1 Tax=Salpingoeca rosetta (strain ATCC 50818 / BSB-021) TaxID=946362 RepID=F2UP47_SALR5|nr:uncharacterized protein PTSG_09813 [Salpingoeca rosetta]EGD79402.1 hypothetical protein PTSG_09813 [Salpingoeca rosetta]|eukprot:XP_004989171.1 hypothetical protein PTSG_09813 [Salpingoeca rosetta]
MSGKSSKMLMVKYPRLSSIICSSLADVTRCSKNSIILSSRRAQHSVIDEIALLQAQHLTQRRNVYFKKQTYYNEPALGYINICAQTQIVKHGRGTFVVDTPKRQHTFQCDNQQEADRWCELLNRAVKSARALALGSKASSSSTASSSTTATSSAATMGRGGAGGVGGAGRKAMSKSMRVQRTKSLRSNPLGASVRVTAAGPVHTSKASDGHGGNRRKGAATVGRAGGREHTTRAPLNINTDTHAHTHAHAPTSSSSSSSTRDAPRPSQHQTHNHQQQQQSVRYSAPPLQQR